MKQLLLAAAATLAVTASAFAQPASAPTVPPATATPPVAARPPGPATPAVLIRNGKIYTVGSAGTIDGGDVLIENGRIAEVGKAIAAPQGATVIDAKGKPVTPGLMASYTQIGIEEVEAVKESNDSETDPAVATAAFDVTDAINPNSTLIPIARIAGVTRSLTAPVTGGSVFAGQAAVIDLGKGPNLVDKPEAAMLVSLGSTGGREGRSRPIAWVQFRELLDDARDYWADRAGYHRPGGARDQRSMRVDLDALGPVIHGTEPLLIEASRASDIRQAVQYAGAHHLKIVILGAEEGWMVAKELAAAHVPVVIDTQHNLPESFADIGATLKNAARMDAAGVTVVFMPESMDPGQYARTIAQVAGNAVPYGMPWAHALAAITRNPAEVWGIADRYGTLDVGKDADVVVWDGDPLEVTSAPTAVFVKGVAMPMVSRQTMLRDRYRDIDRKGLPFSYR